MPPTWRRPGRRQNEADREVREDDDATREQRIGDFDFRPSATSRSPNRTPLIGLGLKVATLRAWRHQGRGPAFVRLGRAIRYLANDIDEFLTRQPPHSDAPLESDLSSINTARRGIMGLWKRGNQYWLDAVVHGHRYREPLGTTDWREAKRSSGSGSSNSKATRPCRRQRASRTRPWTCPRPSSRTPKSGAHRSPQRMAAYWLENAAPAGGVLQGREAATDHAGADRRVPERSDRRRTGAEDYQRRALGPAAGARSERSCGTASPTITRRYATASPRSAAR